jgi:enamine deaminase RidA (YjgF/YER057c/UK114 family)
MTVTVVTPRGWPRPSGYADGVAAEGRVLAISGQIGWDPVTGTFSTDDFAEQTAQALRNVLEVLRAAGAAPEHLVRLTWFVTDRAAYVAARRAVGRAYRDILGAHYPAMSVVVVAGLLEERALVEIEATAVIPA